MKTSCHFLLWVLIAANLLCSKESGAQNVVHLYTYKAENEALPTPARKERRVVFIGDSITEGWSKRQDPEFFADGRYIGRGISGEVTAQMLLRFRSDVLALQPAIVVIGGGTNDIALNLGDYNEDYTLGNIISMAELAKMHKIKVVLASVLPASRFPWRPEVTDAADKIASLNARIQAYARAQKIPYVDYYSAMVYGEDRSLNPAYQRDAVHPNKAGYKVMEALVEPFLK